MNATHGSNESNRFGRLAQQFGVHLDENVWTEHSIIHNWLSVVQRQCSYLYFGRAHSFFRFYLNWADAVESHSMYSTKFSRCAIPFHCSNSYIIPIFYCGTHLESCSMGKYGTCAWICRISPSILFAIASNAYGWCYKLIISSDYEKKEYIYRANFTLDSKDCQWITIIRLKSDYCNFKWNAKMFILIH